MEHYRTMRLGWCGTLQNYEVRMVWNITERLGWCGTLQNYEVRMVWNITEL